MTEVTKRDALDDEIEAVLRENRALLKRTEHTGERLLSSWYAYTDAVHDLLREAGIELPTRRTRASRRRRY
ncbi:MAG TPA: hypothetical protein VK506_15165 [Conexibacter sp.]|nr:hypothetical protein [Conexibacter sp.]